MFIKNYVSVFNGETVSGETLNHLVEYSTHEMDLCIQSCLNTIEWSGAPELHREYYISPSISHHIRFKLCAYEDATGIASVDLVIEQGGFHLPPKIAIAINGVDANNVINLTFYLDDKYEVNGLRAMMENAMSLWFHSSNGNSERLWSSPEDFWDNLERTVEVPSRMEKNA